MSTPPYPVRLVGGEDLRRSRLTVFFRSILIIPHVIVLFFWGIAAYFAIVIAWFAALFTARVPEGLHGFIAGYLRYVTRVWAYGSIVADPFPPFGSGGSYPVDLEIDPPVRQNRWSVFFRYLLAIPCLFVAYVLRLLVNLVAIGLWFVALFTARVPGGLQDVGLFVLRFESRTFAYVALLTPRYPAFGDTPGAPPELDQTALPPVP